MDSGLGPGSGGRGPGFSSGSPGRKQPVGTPAPSRLQHLALKFTAVRGRRESFSVSHAGLESFEQE